jgi:hypothetical protein
MTPPEGLKFFFAKRRSSRRSPLRKSQNRLCRKDRDFYKLGTRRFECPIRKSSVKFCKSQVLEKIKQTAV